MSGPFFAYGLEDHMYDILIIGGGPAGLTAAVYALRAGKTVLVIEKNGFGGQIAFSPKVENIPGTQQISGAAFAEALVEQAMALGADVELETVTAVEKTEDGFCARTEEGSTFAGRAVILALGVKHRMLGLEGEEELVGNGLSFCAVCDGAFYEGQETAMIGGGNSALQEALLLAEKCKEVVILQDLPKCTGEQKLQDLLFARDNVRLYTEVKLTRLLTNEEGLTGVEIEHTTDGSKQIVGCDGLFVAIGLIPENEPFAALADLNSYGYFDAGERCATRTPGIYVAGDCRAKGVRQLTTAVADGATAALAACRYIDELPG